MLALHLTRRSLNSEIIKGRNVFRRVQPTIHPQDTGIERHAELALKPIELKLYIIAQEVEQSMAVGRGHLARSPSSVLMGQLSGVRPSQDISMATSCSASETCAVSACSAMLIVRSSGSSSSVIRVKVACKALGSS
jgi:hypothetical protein